MTVESKALPNSSVLAPRSTKRRSGWPVAKTLVALGISRRTYYRWVREKSWAKTSPAEPIRPVQP